SKENGCAYRGQKQIWYLLRMVGRDCDVRLRASGHPEFDAWRWHDYWVPLEAVIDFKREVYRQALIELFRYLQGDRRARARRAEPVQPDWSWTGATMRCRFAGSAAARVSAAGRRAR